MYWGRGTKDYHQHHDHHPHHPHHFSVTVSYHKAKKVEGKITSAEWYTHDRAAGRHLPLHCVTRYPTQVNAPLSNPNPQVVTRFTYPGGIGGWVDLVAGYIPRWCTCICTLRVVLWRFISLFLTLTLTCLQTVNHQFTMTPSTKRCFYIFDLGPLTPKIYFPKFAQNRL